MLYNLKFKVKKYQLQVKIISNCFYYKQISNYLPVGEWGSLFWSIGTLVLITQKLTSLFITSKSQHITEPASSTFNTTSCTCKQLHIYYIVSIISSYILKFKFNCLRCIPFRDWPVPFNPCPFFWFKSKSSLNQFIIPCTR